jgi:hypothetical protein
MKNRIIHLSWESSGTGAFGGRENFLDSRSHRLKFSRFFRDKRRAFHDFSEAFVKFSNGLSSNKSKSYHGNPESRLSSPETSSI